jgi:hypothetical protein
MKTLDQRRQEVWSQPKWDERVKQIAVLIPPKARVLDLGAGAQSLRKYLPKSCAYTAADIMKMPGALPLDWDAGIYPQGRWGVAVLSGSIEYASHPVSVLFALRDLAPLVLISYEHGGTLARRRLNGFKNHLSKAGLEDLFDRAGWRSEVVGRWKSQVIYRLRV